MLSQKWCTFRKTQKFILYYFDLNTDENGIIVIHNFFLIIMIIDQFGKSDLL